MSPRRVRTDTSFELPLLSSICCERSELAQLASAVGRQSAALALFVRISYESEPREEATIVLKCGCAASRFCTET